MSNRDFTIQVTPEVAQRYPHYQAIVLTAHHLKNTPSNELSHTMLQDAEQYARQHYDLASLKSDPAMQAWRDAYRDFGVKPQRFLNSAEALLTRVLKGQELPRINCVVDAYNAISVRYGLPCGGEDMDHVSGVVQLKFASGEEPFDTMKDGQAATEHPQVGEVVWADDLGVTCRAWNWRQGTRTRLTENSTHAYFLLETLFPQQHPTLTEAAQTLQHFFQQLSPECEVNREFL